MTAEEIAEAAIGAAEAGAAIVHLHARDPKDGRPDQSPERFKPFLQNYQAARELRGQQHDRRPREHVDRGAFAAGVGLAASVGSMESLREVGRYFRSEEFALSL